ncbi:MAG: thioredoxin family protein [Acidimicrobiia bacterium]
MEITIQYFDGCPNWKQTRRDVTALIDELRLGAKISYVQIETPEAAEEHEFRGSPTLLIDGADPFADDTAPVGLTCRVYLTDQGAAGSPSVSQLRAALAAGHLDGGGP